MNLLTNICVPLRELKRPKDATTVLEQAVAAGRLLVEQQPALLWTKSELALAIHDYSMLLRQLKRPDEARKLFKLVAVPRLIFISAYTDYQRQHQEALKKLMP